MEHDLEKAQNLKLILYAFEQLSRLKINFYRSELFCFVLVRPLTRSMPMLTCLDVGKASFP
jgi:hypothetical protein